MWRRKKTKNDFQKGGLTVNNVSQIYINEFVEKLGELIPEFDFEIEEEDVNLYRLGFLNFLPLTLRVYMTEEILDFLQNELLQMEVDAYIDEEALHSSSRSESSMYAKQCLNKYERYRILEWIRNL